MSIVSVKDVRDYLDTAIASYVHDTADNDFQRGYLAALETVRDDMFLTQKERAEKYKHLGR